MSILKVTDDGIFWFLSSDDSHKNAAISADHHVHLLFQSSKYSDFLSIYRTSSIFKEKTIIEDLWDLILSPGRL